MYETESEFLQNYDITKYQQPSLATDIVLLSLQREKPNADIKSINIYGLQVLLIKRASHPCKDKWALPGGFCIPSESVFETAKRELFEETNIADTYLTLSGVYSRKGRDPRGWIISNAFLGLIDRYQCSLRADTDAWEAKWFTIKELSSQTINESMNSKEWAHTLILTDDETGEELNAVTTETMVYHPNGSDSIFGTVQSDFAFDHAEIITEALIKYREQIREDVRPVFALLPETFTLGELTEAYRNSLGIETIMKSNFRRRIEDYVVETDDYADVKGFRPAKLFKRNTVMFMNR